MRVLIINKFLYPNGGSETYIFKLGEALEQHGHEVQYFGIHLFENGLLAYIFTAVAVICGSVVFSVCAKWFLNKVETFLKERVRRVNHV